MITLKHPYDSWLTRKYKWLSLKSTETLFGPCGGGGAFASDMA